VGLQRESKKSQPKFLQLIALGPKLTQAADALGEHQDGFFRIQQTAAVFGGADDLPGAGHESGHIGKCRDPFFHHAANRARRLRFDEHRDLDHRRIQGNLA